MKFFLSFIFILSLTSCSGQKLDSDGGDLTRSEVEYLSKKLSEAVEAEFPILKHSLVNRYVDSLGQSMISRNPSMPPLAYEFKVLKSNDILAFSLPGGIVYITLGLIRAVEFEGQLASALAHELAHQRLNHYLLHWRKKVNANRGHQDLLDFSGDWKSRFIGKGGALLLEKGMEEEADTISPLVLYQAKFDPRVYASYLDLLKKIGERDPRRVAALFSLHPPMKERMAWAKAGQLRLPPLKDSNLSSPTFQRIKAIMKEAEKRVEDNSAKEGGR